MAFNGGSQLAISNPGDGLAVSIAVVNTVLGGSASAIVTMVLHKATDAIRGQDHYWSLIMTINGGLAGKISKIIFWLNTKIESNYSNSCWFDRFTYIYFLLARISIVAEKLCVFSKLLL